MNIENWIKDEKTIAKSWKQYAHFDVRTDISRCRDYITDPQLIASHGFYPFIHYVMKMRKYSLKTKKKTYKKRDICYAAHKDRCIYKYYGYILNELYNDRLYADGLENVPVAYRTDLHMNNCSLSKIAIDFIRKSSHCIVMIGDFTNFFDSLDHNYLKERWCALLGAERLPDDHYAVFKNITRYSKWELEDLLKINGLPNDRPGRKQLNKKRTVISEKQYRKYRNHIQKNKLSKGIPQGSPISAVLANLYMLEADRHINELIKSKNGLYMRYSDDFIIVIPTINPNTEKELLDKVTDIFKAVPELELEPVKTQYYWYEDGSVKQMSNSSNTFEIGKTALISFLGFSFDGRCIRLRQKTISKYYNRLHRKARTIAKCHGYTSKGHKISGKELYILYSKHGMKNPKRKGNFLNYVKRAGEAYEGDSFVEKVSERHMAKIRGVLKREY